MLSGFIAALSSQEIVLMAGAVMLKAREIVNYLIVIISLVLPLCA